MKLDFRENMYVRTLNGIVKIDKIQDNVMEDTKGHLHYGDFVKASYNITDLISRFDLVNGYLVICKMYEDEKDIPTIIKCVGDYYFKEEDIKSVITHEQMEQMEYKVGE